MIATLILPQLAFALIGGFLSRKLKPTTRPNRNHAEGRLGPIPVSCSVATHAPFICGGAFVGLGRDHRQAAGGGVGLGSVRWLKTARWGADGLLRQVKPEDLEAFGLIRNHRAAADDSAPGVLLASMT